MAGPPQPMPMHMPGHQNHPGQQQMHPPHHPGQQQMHPPQYPGQQQMHHAPHAGHPVHGVQIPPAMAYPFYIGFEMVPTILPDGKQTWDGTRPQQLPRSQLELAELVKKDKSKVTEVYNSKLLLGEKRRQIDRILDDHKRLERDHNMEWKIANIKLTTKDLISGLAKYVVGNKVTVTRMRLILKKVLRTPPKATRRQSVPLPLSQGRVNINQQQPPMGGGHQAHQVPLMPQQSMPQQHMPQQQMPQQRMPQQHMPQQQMPQQQMHPQAHQSGQGHPPPPPPMHHGGNRPPMVSLGRSPGVEVLSDDDEEFRDNHKTKSKKKDKKHSSRDRSESPDIRIPVIRDRRASKTSSPPSSQFYDSDGISLADSPATSFSSSPKTRSDPRRRSSQLKKLHHKKGSISSRRDRRGSVGSNDSFVMIGGGSPHGKHKGSTNSYRSHSIEDWSRGISPSHRRRDSEYRDDFNQRSLVRGMERMRVAELERKTEDKRDLQHRIEMEDRIRNLENTVIHQETQTRHGRPSRVRSYSDRQSSIGYLPRSRYEDLYGR